MFRRLAFACATTFAALLCFQANAILIDVDGEQWDVRSGRIVLPYSDPTFLTAQPWWGDSDRAYSFAEAFVDAVGERGFCCDLILLFAYESLSPTAVQGWAPLWSYSGGLIDIWSWGQALNSPDVAYMTATPVPEPGTLSLLLGGGLLLGALRRKHRSV